MSDARQPIQALLDSSPFIRFCGMTVEAIDGERQELALRMPLRPEMERLPGSGQWHGGPIAALIDTAGCFALIMTLRTPVPTVNFRVDYLRPAVNTDLHATARVLRSGKTVAVVDVEVRNDDGKVVAVGRGTFGTQG